MLLNIVLFCGLLSSCKESDTPTPKGTDPIETKAAFELVWSKAASASFTCYEILLSNQVAIFSKQDEGNGFIDALVALDLKTGDTLWVWDEQVKLTKEHLLVNNILYFTGQTTALVYAVNVTTGKTMWTYGANTALTSAINGLGYGNNKLFVSFNYGWKETLNDSTLLFSIDPLSGIGTHEFTLYTKKRGGYRQTPSTPVYWKHPNGNDMLFLQGGGWNWDKNVNQGRGEYYVIDLLADTIYFDLGNFFSHPAIGADPLLLGSNIIISNGWDKNASINLLTGKTNWTTTISDNEATSGGYILSGGDRLYFSAGNEGFLNILNGANGQLVFSNKKVGKSSLYGSKLIQYKNHLYFTTADGLIKTDMEGKIVVKVTVEDTIGGYNGSFTSGLAIDPKTGYMYSTRGNRFMCFKEKL